MGKAVYDIGDGATHGMKTVIVLATHTNLTDNMAMVETPSTDERLSRKSSC